MSGRITFGATITGGIQDVAGLLPLLGTQQCEEHVGSALTKGRLYAAATPMSIFGSLGVARAGFKTFIACISGRTWSGATILANMGFEPKGINLSLVMIDKDDKDRRHLAETRLEQLMNELHIDKNRVSVSHKCTRWNVTVILLTALLSSLSMIPYIHINLGGSNLTHFSQWTFPILRAVGGFLTASMMQIVIERRISRITANHLAQFKKSETLVHAPGAILGSPGEAHSYASGHASHNNGTGDIEKGLRRLNVFNFAKSKSGDSTSSQRDTVSGRGLRNGTLDWVFLVLLLTGTISSVVGYVGCFSVVQNAKSRAGPLSWLCLETGLSVIRMILWGLSPQGDDAPPLELVLRLDHDAILPTCNLDNGLILRQKVLPLTRSTQFLNTITSFAGLVERFTHPDLTLYYTLTRKQRVISLECLDEASLQDSEEASGAEYNDRPSTSTHSDEVGQRVLYITIFDHKERTTRVYTRDGSTERFYSTESDVPLIDLKHDLLETKLDKEIANKDDLIAGDTAIHCLLRTHYQSIMDQIHYTIGDTHDTTTLLPPPACTIESKWTMKAADAVASRERRRREEMVKQGLGRTWGCMVDRGRTVDVDVSQPTFERDRLYFEHGRIEEMRQSFDAARGQWIERYLDLVVIETRDRLEGDTTAMRRVDGKLAEREREGCYEEIRVAVEEGLIDERRLMEKLFAYEVEAWEGLVWNRVKEFMARNDVSDPSKERLMREWRGNCWKRLDTNIHAMDARMQRAKAEIGGLQLLSDKLQLILNSKLKEMHEEIRRAWQSVIKGFVDTPVPSFSSRPGSHFVGDVEEHARHIDRYRWRMPSQARLEQERRQHQEMARRLEKELEDVEFRIGQGLDRCDQFFNDEELLKCRHSRSTSLYLRGDHFTAALDSHSHALKGNNDVIHIDFHCHSDEEYAWFADTICDLPSVASIWVRDPQRLPPIQRDSPLFIYDDRHPKSLETFLNNDQSLTRTHGTYVFIQLADNWTIGVSFIGPSSGSLILRLHHRAAGGNTTLTVLRSSFILTVPESLTIDDISLHPIGTSSSKPSFVPNARNYLVLRTSNFRYTLQDLQLLDNDGNSIWPTFAI